MAKRIGIDGAGRLDSHVVPEPTEPPHQSNVESVLSGAEAVAPLSHAAQTTVTPPPERATNANDGELAVHRRVVRGASAFVAGAVVLVAVVSGVTKFAGPVDLAHGKPWSASSKLFDCHPDRIDCGGVRTSIFFHTAEQQDPWVSIDLGSPTAFSSLTVVNRRDAAKDRAVPLVAEVSDDQATWRQIARSDQEFSTWRPTFEKTTARYVRLRAARRTFLHLEAVKVHP